jgi:hypothetical protein
LVLRHEQVGRRVAADPVPNVAELEPLRAGHNDTSNNDELEIFLIGDRDERLYIGPL